jgi:hypothetical protein
MSKQSRGINQATVDLCLSSRARSYGSQSGRKRAAPQARSASAPSRRNPFFFLALSMLYHHRAGARNTFASTRAGVTGARPRRTLHCQGEAYPRGVGVGGGDSFPKRMTAGGCGTGSRCPLARRRRTHWRIAARGGGDAREAYSRPSSRSAS